MSLKRDGGIHVFGRDGVLRRLNREHTEVVDYVQLSARHVADFTAWKYTPATQELWAGVDGRAVTDEAQLWAVPEDIFPRDPSTVITKPKRNVKAVLEVRQSKFRNYPCDQSAEESRAEHPGCDECEPFQECVGGPTGCLVRWLCDGTLPPVNV